MKILIYGAGVIGCTYGWQLSEAGYNVTILVRPEKKRETEKDGIRIHCSDFRSGTGQVKDIIFRPGVTDSLSSDNDYAYIVVSIGSHHLAEVLPILKKSAGKAHILFFQNLWSDDFNKINQYLSPEQYFFGFPFMAGGGKDIDRVESVISGSKYSKTMLGEADGQISARVQRIATALEKSGMKPFVSGQIKTWLIPHYAFIACMSAGLIKAGGSMEGFISQTSIIKESVRAIREGFHVCKQTGFDPKKEKVNQLYYMPLLICVPVIKKIFSDKSMNMMFDMYLKHARQEIRVMINNIIADGEKYKIQMPNLSKLKEDL